MTRTALLLPLLSAWTFIADSEVTAKTSTPNIIFILADDLGYTDVNSFARRITGAATENMF